MTLRSQRARQPTRSRHLGAYGGSSPAQDPVGPVLTSIRERHDIATTSALTHPLGDAARSAPAHGRTVHTTQHGSPQTIGAQHSIACKALQRSSQNRRAPSPPSTLRGVPQRAPRESRGPSTCRRAVDHDLDVTAGSGDAHEVDSHAPLRRARS